MANSTNARLAGALSRITAAGLTARHVKVETPDGTPMTLTIIDAGRRRAPGLKRGIEANRDEQIAEGPHRAERPTEWA